MSKKVKVGVSIGDINGIGMEVIIKTFMDKRMQMLCTPVIFGSSKVASFHRKIMGIEDFSFNVVENPNKANNKKAQPHQLLERGSKNHTRRKYL